MDHTVLHLNLSVIYIVKTSESSLKILKANQQVTNSSCKNKLLGIFGKGKKTL